MRGPIFNQDSTEFFYTHSADQMGTAAIDAWVDSLADAGVGTLLSNTNAMRANYAGQVWETDWHGYHPAGPDDQPVLKYLPADDVPGTRRRLDSAKRLADMGIDFHERAFARCREHALLRRLAMRESMPHDAWQRRDPVRVKCAHCLWASAQTRCTTPREPAPPSPPNPASAPATRRRCSSSNAHWDFECTPFD